MADDRRPQKPKPKPGAPRDRDVFVPKRSTAPYGVPVVTGEGRASSQGEEWATPDTGTHELAAPERPERDDNTPIGLETLDAEAEFRLRNRVKETNANVRATKKSAESAAIGVTTIRSEMQGHVTRLEGQIEEVKTEIGATRTELGLKVETLTSHVIDAMGSFNDGMAIVAKQQAVPWEAHIDIAANKQKLADKDQADAKKQRRSFWYRAGGVVLKIAAAGGVVAATAIATHYVERC